VAKGKRNTTDFKRSGCPVANALDLFGDKWTLIVIRDLVVGKRRYGDFQKSPEGIPTNILADRLRQLEQHEVIRKAPYQRRPPRYEYHLTEKGADLLPVLQAMARWANIHVPGSWRQSDSLAQIKPEDFKR
jgi:DNA-binding HxlR family transcriptional regulator